MAAHAPYFVNFAKKAGALYASGWDLVTIGGVQLPGIARIDGASLMLRRNPNNKAGANGGNPVYHGLEEQQLRITVIVWTNEQLEALRSFLDAHAPLPGVQPKNFSLVSEWTKLTKIDRISIVGFGDLQPHTSARVANGLQVTITAAHYLGGAKKAKANVTVQPRRTYSTTRPYTPPPGPASTAGACGPQFTPGS